MTTKPMIYLGIDPGKSGGIAAVDTEGVAVFAVPMPRTHRAVLDVCLAAVEQYRVVASLELVHAFPGDGVVSVTTFLRGYGALEMALTAARIRYATVAPAVWQRALGCLTRGDKNVTKRHAQQRFPELRVTHALADAVLIAEYTWRRHTVRWPSTEGHTQPRRRMMT